MNVKDKDSAPIGAFLVVPKLDAALKFYAKAFGAKEDERYQDPKGKVWYAVVDVLGLPLQLMEPFPDMGLVARPKTAKPTDSIMVAFAVKDVDKTFAAATKAGAQAIAAPQHEAIGGVRFGEVRDPAGHRWSIRQAVDAPSISGIHVVPKLDAAIKFYMTVLGAKNPIQVQNPATKVRQADLSVLGATLHLMEPSPALGLQVGLPKAKGKDSAMLSLSVKDVDATFKKATQAGAIPIIKPQDAYWGDRYAEFRAPTGLRYACCSRVPLGDAVINPADMKVKFDTFLADHNNPASPAQIVGVHNV